MKKRILIIGILIVVFNLFTLTAYASFDSGAVDTEFVGSVNNLINDNWDDSFFSYISFRIGDDKMLIDGIEQPMSPAAVEDGELYLPIIDMATAVGAGVDIDMGSGQITIFDDEQKTIIASPLEEEISHSRRAGKNGKIREFVVNDDGSVEGSHSDGTKFKRKPRAKARLAEESLHIEVIQEKNEVFIVRPLQLRQLVVQTKDKAPLADTFGAREFVSNDSGFYLIQYNTIRATEAAYDSFNNSSNIEFVTPNKIIETESISWGTERIAADLFKEKLVAENKTQTEINVAVVDTGVDVSHPFLSGRIADAGYNFVNNNTNPRDGSGHGTHVSGTIVDCSTSNIKIMPVKSLDDNGDGTYIAVYLGIKYAADQGARVINLSLGSYDPNPKNLVAQAVNYATAKGSICVAAAGNESRDVRDMCPANLANTIAVSATDKADLLASFSNYGNGIDVAAPGVSIYSCIPNKRYASLNGTSMAAPHVSASVAMLIADEWAISPSNVMESLQSITGDIGPGTMYGKGIVDFSVYFESIDPGIPGDDKEPPGAPGDDKEPPGVPGDDKEAPKAPGDDKKPPGAPGDDKESPKAPGDDKKPPGTPGDDKKPPGEPENDKEPPDNSNGIPQIPDEGAESPFISGYPDGSFKPDARISRAEAIQILYNMIGQSYDLAVLSDFNDIDISHWAINALAWAIGQGYLRGNNNGALRPNHNITRAELAAVLHRVRQKEDLPNKTSLASRSFNDIEGHWAYDDIIALANNGIVNGYSDGSFKPENFVTRAEAVVMIARMFGRTQDYGLNTAFSDVLQSHWAFAYIMNAVNGHSLLL